MQDSNPSSCPEGKENLSWDKKVKLFFKKTRGIFLKKDRIRNATVCVGAFALGCFLIWLNASHLLNEIGIAIVISAILGPVLEFYFHKTFADNIFQAVYYFKVPELIRIQIEEQLLRVGIIRRDTRIKYELRNVCCLREPELKLFDGGEGSRPGEDKVLLITTVDYIMQNCTDRYVVFPLMYWVDMAGNKNFNRLCHAHVTVFDVNKCQVEDINFCEECLMEKKIEKGDQNFYHIHDFDIPHGGHARVSVVARSVRSKLSEELMFTSRYITEPGLTVVVTNESDIEDYSFKCKTLDYRGTEVLKGVNSYAFSVSTPILPFQAVRTSWEHK